jgi:hypothetical protein
MPISQSDYQKAVSIMDNANKAVANAQTNLDSYQKALSTAQGNYGNMHWYDTGVFNILSEKSNIADLTQKVNDASAKLTQAQFQQAGMQAKFKIINDQYQAQQKQQATAAQQADQTAQTNAGQPTTDPATDPNDHTGGNGTAPIVVTAPHLPPQPRGTDERVRLYAPLNTEADIYGPNDPSNILNPLYATKGLMFPYTPTIAVAGESTWEGLNLVHTNYDILSYQRTPSATISITAKFTVQNQREGEYTLAAIHFMRTVTKMYYGRQDDDSNANKNATKGRAGLPPPVLLLEGYGDYMFNGLRVVVKSFSFNLDDTQDMIKITAAGGTVWLPPVVTLSITLGMQQSALRTSKQFSLSQFRTGALMRTPQSGWF